MSDISKTIFRTAKRENPFVQIDKTVLNDIRLSWKAKGLLAFLLSKPDHWEINIKNLIKQSRDGKEAVYSGINELIKFGYIVRIESRNKGRFSQIEYLIYENPQLANSPKAICPREEFGQAQPNPIKISLPENPDTVNRETELPDTENPPLINNDLSVINDLTKDPPNGPTKKLQGVGESKPDLLILEPIALKLFGQTNQEILENLWSKIKEFKLESEVVQECLNQIDAKEIKFNPYGYFKGIFAIATTIVTKRMQALERQREMEELLKEQHSLSHVDTDGKSTDEIIAEIKRNLGITKNTNGNEKEMKQ